MRLSRGRGDRWPVALYILGRQPLSRRPRRREGALCRAVTFALVLRIAVFSVTVLHDDRVVLVAEQRPDASEEDSFQWMGRVLQVGARRPGPSLRPRGVGSRLGSGAPRRPGLAHGAGPSLWACRTAPPAPARRRHETRRPVTAQGR